jgi:hypothetical protein
MSVVPFDAPSLHATRPPRCPPFATVTDVSDLLPYLDAVARRPYHTGLWPAWDLQENERVLLHVSNWHDPMVVEAAEETLRRFKTRFTTRTEDRGEIPHWQGHDEVEYYLARTFELMRWMDEWEEWDAKGTYDKVLQGYGGPILAERNIKIQRMPFITPEMVVSPAHTYPHQLLRAIDEWTWDKVTHARRVHITDPEGTDLRFTNHDEYYDSERRFYAEEWVRKSYPQNIPYGRTYLPGHVWGRPSFHIPQEDGTGVIAGTMNHIAPFPRIEMTVENSEIVAIDGGGEFGDKLRALKAKTDKDLYPGYHRPGLFQWWEASIGTNVKIHRPRHGYAQGYNCGLYERMRSGIIHLGYGTVVSSEFEREADRQGLTVGHFHVHLNFPTYHAEMIDGSEMLIINQGRLGALDDPAIRELAAQFGDPDELLQEDWIPAIPGLNMAGDYMRDYATDPMDWTMTELHVCERYHPMFMKMIATDGDAPACHHS